MRPLRRGLRAAREAGLIARNWSGGGQIVLALYDADDGYLGTVELTERGPVQMSRCGMHWRRHE